jgi:hypothetical protein
MPTTAKNHALLYYYCSIVSGVGLLHTDDILGSSFGPYHDKATMVLSNTNSVT